MMAGTPDIYSIDASALIHGWHRAYPPGNFPPVWEKLGQLIANGHLLMCEDALIELERKDDDLYKWCKGRPGLVVEVDDAIQNKMTYLMGTYPKLVDTAKNKSGADPFVIALAMAHNPTLTVITEEKGGTQQKPKIPYVCNQEGIRQIDLLQLIRDLNWVIGV